MAVPGGNQVHRYPGQRHRQHQPPIHHRRCDQAPDGFVDDQGRDHEQGHAIGQAGQHLRPPHAEGQASLGWSGGQTHHDQRKGESAGVGQHMAGV